MSGAGDSDAILYSLIMDEATQQMKAVAHVWSHQWPISAFQPLEPNNVVQEICAIHAYSRQRHWSLVWYGRERVSLSLSSELCLLWGSDLFHPSLRQSQTVARALSKSSPVVAMFVS